MTTGNAVPSLSPPSPVRAKRNWSRSLGLATCTSEASTGSVGARMPPSKTAAPSERPSNAVPIRATATTVTSIETRASRSGGSQRRSCKPALSLSPEVKSEIRTTASVSRSSMPAAPIGSIAASPSQAGLRPAPTAR